MQPAGAYHQWDNLWSHHYKVAVNADGSFEGTSVLSGNDGWNDWTGANAQPETIKGQFTRNITGRVPFGGAA